MGTRERSDVSNVEKKVYSVDNLYISVRIVNGRVKNKKKYIM